MTISRFLLALVLAVAPTTAFAEDQTAFRQAAKLTPISTGSKLAVWRLAGDARVAARKTPVVFLHGGPGLYTERRRVEDGAIFRAAGFTTIYFDQAGGGVSERLPATQYGLARAIDDLEALRMALGAERMILWGNSFGASLAALYAGRYPDRVAGIILTSPGMYPGFDGKRDYAVTARGPVAYSREAKAAINLIDSKGGAAEAALSQADAGRVFDALVSEELIDGLVCKGATMRPEPLPGGGNLYAQRAIFRDLKKAAVLPANAAPPPSLIVRGACDFIPAKSADLYRQRFAATYVEMPKSGHGLLENRVEVEAALAQFVMGPLKAVP